MKINVNGQARELDVEPDTPLLWAIRENAGLTGTKYGCGNGQCGGVNIMVAMIATRPAVFRIGAILIDNILPAPGDDTARP